MGSAEIKYEPMDPTTTDWMRTMICSELQARYYANLVTALIDAPLAIIPLEGVPIVSALAIIGYNPSEITDITYTGDPDGNTAVNFKTPGEGDNPASLHCLKIPQSTEVMFFADGYGRFGFRDRIVGLSQVTGKATPDFEAIPAIMTQVAMQEQSENIRRRLFFSCDDCVVVHITPQLRKDLFKRKIGLPGPTFAFVQRVTPLPSR